jgi:chemotaxis protein histidine kinase CheA/CheY-like chemotaxis protein
MCFDAATLARLASFFVAEAEETVAALVDLGPRLRAGGDAEALTDFRRMTHGLKGAAATIGLDGLAAALHALEELSNGLEKLAPAVASARHDRIAHAVALLGEGIARMSASSAESFPADLLAALADTVAADAPGERPAGEPAYAAPGAAPSPSEPSRPRSASAAPAAAAVERISVPAEEVDEALRLASSLARSAAQLHERLGAEAGTSSTAAGALAAAALGLEGIIADLRLVPAEVAFEGLDEEVARLAEELGKQVTLSLGGGDVRADRRTLQSARGMIRHLVRNALDHGLEGPSERRAARKPETGRLRIEVAAGESALRVTVEDDGAGFDLVRIRADLARRAVDAERIATLSDEELLQLWAFEGGSTRASATHISGRGLGLSAVASMARAAGGGIHVRSAAGAGSSVLFTLPLEVYAVEVLAVGSGGRLFGLPLQAIERTVHLAAAGDALHDGPTGRTLAVGEGILPLTSMASVLGATPVGPDRFALVVRAEGGSTALGVEEVGSAVGVVPATVPGVAQADALVTGLARLGGGEVISILNPRLLLARARTVRASPRPEPRAAPAAAARPAPERPAPPPRGALDVVLAEDSLATREVLRVLLEQQGFRVRLAADGEEALQRIGERLPDVVVTDVNMPRRDGLSLARELRRRTASARLPIVLLTSRDDDATRAAGASAGADAYLVKSRFNAGVLLDTLARIGVRPAP